MSQEDIQLLLSYNDMHLFAHKIVASISLFTLIAILVAVFIVLCRSQ